MEQRTEEWHKARKGRITGSAVGAILGLAPYRSRDDVLRAMVRDFHGAESEFVTNPAIEWGVANEATATAMFTLETGLAVEACGFFPLGDYMGASPDGLIGDDAILEVKCPWKGVKKTLAEQPHYVAQLEFEMAATGRNKAYFWQWHPSGETLEVCRSDPNWWVAAMPEIESFWNEYQEELHNPAHLEPLRIDLTGNNRAVMLVAEYDDLREAKDNADERMKEIIAELSKHGRNAIIGNRKLTKVSKEGLSATPKLSRLCVQLPILIRFAESRQNTGC